MPRFRAIGRRHGSVAAKALIDTSYTYGSVSMTYADGGYRPNVSSYNYARHDLPANSVVSIGLAWIRRNVHKGRIIVGNEKADGTYAESPGHPLADLLRQPNPWQSWKAMLGATAECVIVDGNAYWLKARNRVDRGIEELYWAPNHEITVEPEPDPNLARVNGPIRRYWHQVGSYRQSYEPAEVVHFRNGIDPYCKWMGLSDLKRQIRNVASIDFGERYTSAILRHAHAGKAIVPREDRGGYPDESEMDGVERQIRRATSEEGAGRLVKVNLPVDLLDLGDGPEAMLLDRIMDRPEAMILAAVGLNALTLGLPSSKDTSTYANKGEARREAWESAVIPVQDLIGDEIEAQLLPDFPSPPADSVWWDRRDVEALREDANERATRQQLIADIASINERRGLVDLKPVEGGDETPVEKAERAAAMADQIAAGQDEDEDENESAFGRNGAAKGFDPGQARDRSGQWTTGSGGAGGRSVAPANVDVSRVVVAFRTGAPAYNLTQSVQALRAGGLVVAFGGKEEMNRQHPGEDHHAIATYNYEEGKIYLNRNHDFWDDPTHESQEKGYYEDFSTDAPEHVLRHEAAHVLHHSLVGNERIAEIAESLTLTDDEKRLARDHVSKYAAAAPGEFVAEVYVGFLWGKRYPKAVMDAYAKYEGPPLRDSATKSHASDGDEDEPTFSRNGRLP